MSYVSDVALEVRGNQRMVEQIMEDFRRATSARAEVLAEDKEIQECLKTLVDNAFVDRVAGAAVLRYYSSAVEGSANWDAAAWIIREETEARGWSGYYIRIGDDKGDQEQQEWGDDGQLYENHRWIKPFVTQEWCRPALFLSRYDLMNIAKAGRREWDDQDVHKLVSAVLPGVRELVAKKADELGLGAKPARTDYHLVWEIDIDAETPKDAAMQAWRHMREAGSMANVFTIFTEDGESVRVDLSEETTTQEQ